MNRLNQILKLQGRTQTYLSRELNKSTNIDAKRISKILNIKIEDLIDEDLKEDKK